jgi:hypothetical protein
MGSDLMLTMPLIALALGTALAQPAEPPMEAAFVVMVPDFNGLDGANDRLISDTERLLAALDAECVLRYRRSGISRARLDECLGGGADPSPERRACLRRLLPAREAGAPVVAIVLGFTGERGAWQRMECIGPRSNGVQPRIYANEGFHPRADIRARTRAQLLQCVAQALRL